MPNELTLQSRLRQRGAGRRGAAPGLPVCSTCVPASGWARSPGAGQPRHRARHQRVDAPAGAQPGAICRSWRAWAMCKRGHLRRHPGLDLPPHPRPHPPQRAVEPGRGQAGAERRGGAPGGPRPGQPGRLRRGARIVLHPLIGPRPRPHPARPSSSSTPATGRRDRSWARRCMGLAEVQRGGRRACSPG